MASVIDSCKDIFGERMSFLKIAVLTIPVYLSYQVFTGVTDNDYLGFWLLVGITAFLLLGYITEITSNVINEKNIILPSLNPFLIVYSAIKGLIALAPVVCVGIWIANYLCSFIDINLWVDNTLKTIIWLTAASFIGTTFLMFAEKQNIIDAFNIKLLFQKAGDFIIASIFYIIQFFLVNLISSGFIGYIIFILFGYGIIFDIFVAFIITFNITALGHFLGQAYYELIGYNSQLT